MGSARRAPHDLNDLGTPFSRARLRDAGSTVVPSIRACGRDVGLCALRCSAFRPRAGRLRLWAGAGSGWRRFSPESRCQAMRASRAASATTTKLRYGLGRASVAARLPGRPCVARACTAACALNAPARCVCRGSRACSSRPHKPRIGGADVRFHHRLHLPAGHRAAQLGCQSSRDNRILVVAGTHGKRYHNPQWTTPWGLKSSLRSRAGWHKATGPAPSRP